MSTAKEELLTLAQELASSTTEAHWRAAVSRAYYAAYHGCKDWHAVLPAPGSVSGPAGGVHQTLINQLNNPAPHVKNPQDKKLSKILSIRLGLLKHKRHASDYQLSDTVDQVVARNACTEVAELLQKL